jgi:acyl carrier protein
MSMLTSEAEILADLRRVFRESLGVDPVTPIDPGTKFFADLGLASIDAVVLGEAIQQRSGRPVPFDQLLADLGGREQRDLEIRELIAFLQRHLRP